MNVQEIRCIPCNQIVQAVHRTGAEVYPHRKDLYDKIFYCCPQCNNFVGTHKDSGKPLGCIVSKDVKQARILIHALIDPLYKNKLISRKQLYRRIAEKLGRKSYHTANIRTIEEAREVYKVGLEIKKAVQPSLATGE